MIGHLNSFSASGVGGGNLNKNFPKNSNAREGCPGGGDVEASI